MGVEPVVAARAEAGAAAAALGVEFTLVHDAAGCAEVRAVLDQVWGKVNQFDILVALAHSGNYVGLASRDGQPVGAAVGFFGPPGMPFHSHAVGILPAAVGGGIGRAIKLDQRAWCLERGVTTMAWTYDPLIARNAHFNIHRLGARPVSYHPDFYGELTDAINAGQATDRMLLHWDLMGPSAPRTDTGSGELITIPSDIEAMRRTDPAAADEWRRRTRLAFTTLFDAGYHVADFIDRRSYLLLPPTGPR